MIPQSVEARLMRGDGCWSWLGWHASNGYARVTVDGRRLGVHRLMYEAYVGEIPAGDTLDHLCRNRGCVNPSHLEPVSNRENILRGVVPSANRTVCKNGIHDITCPGGIFVDSEGVERCHECRLESKRRSRQRKGVGWLA